MRVLIEVCQSSHLVYQPPIVWIKTRFEFRSRQLIRGLIFVRSRATKMMFEGKGMPFSAPALSSSLAGLFLTGCSPAAPVSASPAGLR